MAIIFSGAVDNFRQFDTLGGWAKYIKDGVRFPVDITAYDGSCVLGKTKVVLPRGDTPQIAFLVQLSKSVDIDDLRSGRIKVFAESDGLCQELPLIEPMLAAFEARCVGKRLSSAGDNVIRHLVSELTAHADTPYLKGLAQGVERANQIDQLGILEGVEGKEGSAFLLPIGLKSADGAAVVGYDGNLFILGGTNNLITSYNQRKDDEVVQKLTAEWMSLFRSRSAKIGDLNAKYIQMIIPDKSSVLPEKFPLPIDAPTALLSSINEAALAEPALTASYIDVFELFLNDADRSAVFQKTDSHLSAYGSNRLINKVLDHLKLDIDLSTNFSRRKLGHGDLGSKYLGTPLLEEFWLPETSDFAQFEQGLVQEECMQPAKGRNSGIRIKWTNTSAPLALRVVAFANSFFERGGAATTLSWWASRCFREFHFLWETNVNYDYVRLVRPDVVICQTVERFIRRVADE
jgi:hypothetical protein